MTVSADIIADALRGAIATRGAHKGRFLAKAPPSHTMAYAAWQGAMLAINPYKASIVGLMLMTAEQRAVCDAVTKAFDALPKAQKAALDRDRHTLETLLGAW
jgi:hypothetical protein